MKYLSLVWASLFRSRTRTLLTLLSVVAASRLSITQMLPYSLLSQIETTPGVKKVAYAAWFGGIYRDPKDFFPNFSVGPNYLDLYPEYVIPPAQRRAFDADRTGAVVGAALAKRFGW